MSRFLKLASALVVVCSLFSVAAPTAVQAHDHFYPPVMNQHHDCREFDLYLGSCPHSLEYYGVYTGADAVQAVAREFNKQGYYVSIRPRF